MKSFASQPTCDLSLVNSVPAQSVLVGKTPKARGDRANLVSTLGRTAKWLRCTGTLSVIFSVAFGHAASAQGSIQVAPSEWTWAGGSGVVGSGKGISGIYGTQGIPATGNVPGSRNYPGSWTDSSGNFWLFGGNGYDANGNRAQLNDLWEYNTSTNLWTWMGGSDTYEASGVYGTQGIAAATNIPGARSLPKVWLDSSGNVWLFGGIGYDSTGTFGYLNDLWEYNPSANQWTWMGGSSSHNQAGIYGTLGAPSAANVPGSRSGISVWTDQNGNFWLLGGYGYDATGTLGYQNDMWEYSPATNQWTWMGGSNTVGCTYCYPAAVYGTEGTPAAGNTPSGRQNAVRWTDSGGNFWLFGGYIFPATGGTIELNDLWEFSPSTNMWTWMGGSSAPLGNQNGEYGTQGTPASGNIPGSRDSGVAWADTQGNFWLFGGYGFTAAGGEGNLGDLWEFSPFTDEWTWMVGSNSSGTTSNSLNRAGVYGTLGVPGTGNFPGSRYADAGWVDQSDNLWMSGGEGEDANKALASLNDLWVYQPAQSSMPQAAPPTFSLPAGTYTSAQKVTINATPGATIYYTTNGTAPNTGSPVYGGGPITVSSIETLEAVATASGYSNSGIASATYKVIPPTATPMISLASGTYDQPQTVTISDATPGAVIFYAINGTATINSTVYSGQITVSSTETLQAIALASGYSTSARATASYTDNVPAATNPGEWTWVGGSTSGALGVWGTLGTPAAANTPGDRQNEPTWTDAAGHFWLFGGNGADANGNWSDLNDLWEYDPATNLWTWVSGSSTTSCGPNGCSQPGVYGTLGTPAAGNVPGGRQQASTWIDSSGNLWLFGGNGTDSNGNWGYLNDLWKFTPSTNLWTWVAGSITVGSNGGQTGVYGTLGTPAAGNMPGGRYYGESWTDNQGNLWLFGGGGYDSNGTSGTLNDVWEFNPSTNEWTWKGGSNTVWMSGIYGTLGTPAPSNIPGSRAWASNWTDSAGNFWLFGGMGFDGFYNYGVLNDLWEFNPSTNQWTWMGGSNKIGSTCQSSNGSSCGQIGVYGTLGTPAAGNIPGSRFNSSNWTDSSGNLWLFAGSGFDSTGAYGTLNELWEFNPFTNQWAWIGGSNTVGSNGGQPGVYGTLGVPAAGNIPGARANPATWTGSNGNLWLMGGCGFNASDIGGCFNDLWVYQPSNTVSSPTAATPGFSLAPGNYTTIQTLTITDATPGATIYYTTNGTAPTINSAVYSSMITISSPETFEAIATAGGYSNSAVATAVYNVVVPATATPTISLASGTYDQPQPVTLSDATPGAIIYYAINATPTTSSAVYTGPITVSSTETLEAIALAPGDSISGVASATYTDTLPAATSAGEWTWVGGNKTVGSSPGYPGVYGTLGTPAPGNIPGARSGEVSWTDKSGNLWLFGGLGFDINGGTSAKRLNDVWMLSPSTNEWTWMGGSATNQASAVCGTMGTPAAGNIPGARYSPNSWTDSSGNFWLFGGSGYDCNGNEGPLNDLWEFNPTTNLWIWVGGSNTNTEAGVYGTLGVAAAGNIPGSRENGMSWTDSSGNLWLFGGQGLDSTSNTTKGYLNDLWMFNPSTKLWTWMGGSNVDGNVGSTVGPTPGVYGTLDTPAPGNVPSGREYANAWTDSGGNLWLFGGDNKAIGGSTIYLNDLWEFNTTTNQWTWVSGSSASGGDQNGVYSSEGTPAPTNAPGSRTTASSWTDSRGNFWLLGGQGYDHGTGEGYLNDLWEFNPPTSEWTWIAGSNTRGPGGTYGTLGMPSSTNAPGVRYNPASWRDSIGNFWIFGGEGKDANATFANLNDLWEYQPAATLPPTATPTFSVPAGSYTSVQTVTINDATAGATIYCSTNGTAPNINSPVCSGPITVSSTETLEAIAVASGYSPSATTSAAYTVILPTATPTISLASDTYDQPQTATLSDATPGATIYYAINATPTTSSTVYSGPITVSSTETLEAIALAGGYSTSAVATASYTDNVPVATSAGEWTWVSGSSVVGAGEGASEVLGTLGTPAAGNVPGSRKWPAYWTDSSGNFWLFGGSGHFASGGQGLLNDLWEFNKATNLWTWMGGSTTFYTSGVYGTRGEAAAGNMPGSRSVPTVWQDGSGNLWLFGGAGTDSTGATGYLNDLWKYNPSTNQWTWMSGSSTGGSSAQSGVYGTLGTPSVGNMPGGRDGAVGWTDKNGNLWLFGGYAYDANGTFGYLNDLWEFNPSTTEWTWMGGSNSLGCAVSYCATSATYGTLGTPAAGNTPGGRKTPATWTDSGGNFWLLGGFVDPVNGDNLATELNDLWEFSPSTNQWTWMGGSNAPAGNQSGVYGTMGTPAATNFPGGRDSEFTWTDAQGNLWLFGGEGYNASGADANLGDLWEYSPFTNEWTWMVGSNNGTNSNSLNRTGVVGTIGIPAATNFPGSRGFGADWVDQSGNLWLMGGYGEDASKAIGYLNDLWEYQPAQVSASPTATPTFSVPAGSYTSVQTVTINDATAGATIYCSTNGTAPNINSPVCSGPITVSSTETLEAIAVASGDTPSMTATAAYTINLATPTITWATPAPITYGTALSATQLDAGSTMGGTFVYSPAIGTLLTAGSQTLSVTFTPTDTTDYTTATTTVQLTVNQATPAITWSNPSPITYGTALSATQLNAGSTVSGTFVYSPAIGTVLTAGTQTLSVTFTPTDTTDYTTATTNVQLTVSQAMPSISWSTPAAINYGTVLSATQLDASSPVAGNFSYSPSLGTVLTAGTQALSVTFTPTDTTDYTTATGGTTIVVNKATPTINWPMPAAINYGTALSAAQLDATSLVPGTLLYTPAAGTVLGAGSQSLSVTFTPTDTADYTTATGGTTIMVNKATPTISWSTPTAIPYGTALSATQLNATASVAGTFVYSPVAGTMPQGGSQLLSVTFTPTDTADYTTATASVTLTVSPIAQTITFPALSSPVTYGASPITLSATTTSGLTVTFSATGPATVSGNTLNITGAGTVVITASQAGNNDYTAATPVSRNLTVSKATPASNLSASETTGSYGDSVMLTATLTGGDVPPSGTVTFRNGGTSIGTGTLSGGVATLTTTSLPAGGDSLTATYAGDSNYKTATSNTVTVTLNLQAQSISFALPSPVTFGVSPITLSATATSGLAVTFSVTGPATLSGSKLTITGAGTVIVTASQAGNANYSAATSVSQTLIVNQATPTVTWTNPAAITYGTALSATQLKARASVPGTFVYNPAAGAIPTAGTQTLSVTFTPTDTIDYTTATGTATLVVNPAATTITWSNLAAITYGTSLGATQLNASSTVAGTYVYTPPAGTVLTVGSQTLSVTLTPDDTTDYAAATKTVTLNVKQAKPTITWATPASILYGTPLGAAQQNATASTDGTFAYSPAADTVLGVGTHTLSVTFTPTDTTDYTTATATVSQTVAIASQTITFTPLSSSVVYGVAPIALPATASSGLTVKFSVLSGPGTISGSTLTITGAGTVVVAANQAGNADYTAAAQVTQTVVVDRATPAITLTSSAATITHGSSVTFTATLTGVSTKPTGTVIFFDGATQLGTGTLNGSGVGKYTTTTLAVGGHSITASYGGDTNYLTVTSTAVGVTVQ